MSISEPVTALYIACVLVLLLPSSPVMSQTRIKRSYDMFASTPSSSYPFSSSSSSTLVAPSHPTSFDSPFESVHKRSRLQPSTPSRQMSEEDSAMAQLSPTSSSSSSSSSRPNDGLTVEAITSDALSLSSTSVPRTTSPSSRASPSLSSSSPSSSASSSYRHPSPFVSRGSFDVPAFVESFPLKRKRPHPHMDDSQQPPHKQSHTLPSSSSPPSSLPSSSSSSPASYSLDQVKRIVQCALQLQEERLREEFEKLLSDLLREQFANFERFNKDYISRQVSKTELSYLS